MPNESSKNDTDKQFGEKKISIDQQTITSVGCIFSVFYFPFILIMIFTGRIDDLIYGVGEVVLSLIIFSYASIGIYWAIKVLRRQA